MTRFSCSIPRSVAFETMRQPMIRSLLSSLVIMFLFMAQIVLPLASVYAQTKGSIPDKTATALGSSLEDGRGSTQPTQRGQLKASDPTACDDCDVSMRKLDLSRPPTETELRRAGQMGGALSPISTADVVKLATEIDKQLKQQGINEGLRAQASPKMPVGKILMLARERIKRLEQANLSFGQAIQEWNKHNYKIAAKMFEKHVKQYPESPWSGEALLHMGCDAKYNGRFAEAEARYSYILKSTSSHPKSKSYDVHQKAKLRWADLDIALGKLNDASAKLTNILKTDKDWRRRTWASYWLFMVQIYKRNARDLRACGTQALSVILASLDKQEAATRLARMKPPRDEGFTLAELETIAIKHGVQMRGFRATTPQLAQLPTPFIIHYDYAGTAKTALAPKMKVASNHKVRLANAHSEQDPFHASPTLGHFMVVKKVDQKKRVVSLYDPQERRLYYLSYADMAKQWSGSGLAVMRQLKRPAPKVAASTQDSSLASQNLPITKNRIVWLSEAEMNTVLGGCCGVFRALRNLGRDLWNKAVDALCNDGRGSPLVSINQLSLNMYVEDTPMWYDSPVGPGVKITMNYNSMDALNQNTVFGNKWAFNYGSYVVEDTAAGGGVVTIFMPDGAQHVFYPNGSGGYNNQVGVFDRLRKKTATRYELTSPTGDMLIYDIPPGTDSLQPLLIAVQDRWGQSLKMGYEVDNYNIQLTTITDALGRVTRLSYDERGHIVRAADPFGRYASFRYDLNGNMIEATDMEGNSFQYTYDADVIITQLNTAQGPWKYDTISFNTADKKSMYLTITDPLKQKQKYVWTGVPGQPMYHHDQKGNVTQFYISEVIDGKQSASRIVYPNGDATNIRYDANTGLPGVIVDARGNTTQTTYNAMGRVTSTIDAKGQITRFYYDPSNGVDLLSVRNAQGQTLVTYQYNDFHQPTLITNLEQHQTHVDYTAWGAVALITGPDNVTANHNYNSSTKQLTSITSGAATLANFSYDDVGRVKTSTSAAGVTLSYEYSDLNNPTKVTYPDGTYEAIEYACCNLPGVTRDRSGRKTYYDYDELKRLRRVQDAAKNSVHYDYDATGNLEMVMDSRNNVTRWQYDSMGRMSKKIYTDGSSDSYSYDTLSNSVSRRDAQGKITRSYFDDNSNLIRIDYPVMPDVTIAYDALNRPYRMNDGIGITRYTYDASSRITSIDGPWANDTITYHYDAQDRRDWMKINGTDQVSYGFDSLDRLQTITSPAGAFTWNYIGNTSIINQLTLPNGAYTTYAHDALKRLTSVHNKQNSGDNISHYAYGFDSPGYEKRNVRTWMEATVGTDPLLHVNYGYDEVDQLRAELSTETVPSVNASYTYDSMGNRTQVDNNGLRSTYNPNPLNQYASLTNTVLTNNTTTTYSLGYDAKGNLSSQSTAAGGTSFSYDDANRLIGIIMVDPQSGANVHKSEFLYDGLNRKVITREYTWNSQANSWNTATETRYLYDGRDVVQERDGTNTVKVNYTRSGNIGGLLARTVKGTGGGADAHYYYHYDGSGNVTQLTNAAQQTVATYFYDAFGNTTANGPQSGQPYRFSTKAQHAHSGLYDYGYRFYSPNLGRWLNRDPIKENGGLNLYGFAVNSPTNVADVDGRFAVPLVVVGGGLGAAFGAAANAYTQYTTNRRVDLGEVFIAAASGGAAGALATTPVGSTYLGAMAIGMTTNGYQNVFTQWYKHGANVTNKFDGLDLMANLELGALGGALGKLGGELAEDLINLRPSNGFQNWLNGKQAWNNLHNKYPDFVPKPIDLTNLAKSWDDAVFGIDKGTAWLKFGLWSLNSDIVGDYPLKDIAQKFPCS